MNFKNTRASALLTALFMVSIIAMVAVSVAYEFRLSAHLAFLNKLTYQSRMYAEGLRAQAQLAIESYDHDWQMPTNHSRFLILPQRLGPFSMSGFALQARLVDATSLYNINNLVYPGMSQGFMNLFSYLLPQVSQTQALQITSNIVDWLSPKTDNNSDQLYANQVPPYRAAHRPMLDISELRQVAGVTPAIFSVLSRYVTALPTNGQPSAININTATLPVFLTLSAQITVAQAEQLYHCREEHGVFLTLSDYNDTCANQVVSALTGVNVYSNYFLVAASVSHDDHDTELRSLVSILQDPQSHVRSSYVVWQMFR